MLPSPAQLASSNRSSVSVSSVSELRTEGRGIEMDSRDGTQSSDNQASGQRPISVANSERTISNQTNAPRPKRNTKVVEEDDIADNPVLSVDNLTQWLINYGSSANHLLESSMRLFRDDNGTLRDSLWRPIREATNPLNSAPEAIVNATANSEDMDFNDVKAILDQTGCISLPIVMFENDRGVRIPEYQKKAKRRSGAKIVVEVKEDPESPGMYHRSCLFLSDWQRLWNYLKNDKQDEIARNAPFLRMCVELFFHRRTVQLMYFLFAWNFMVQIILQVYLPTAIPNFIMTLNYVTYIFELAVYLTACVMNKGTLPKFFEINPFRKKNNGKKFAETRPQLDEVVVLDATEHHVHWLSTVRQFGRKSCFELFHFFQTVKEDSDSNRNFSRKGMYFYKWMNMSMKVLSRLNGVDFKKTNFNRKTYRAVLLFAVFFFPLYVVALFIATYGKGLTENCHDDANGKPCRYYYLNMVLTGGGLTLVLFQYIYAAAIMISLAGLAYGGEIAFRLADGWLQKYGCLRRVSTLDSCFVDRDLITRHLGGQVASSSKLRAEIGQEFRVANGFQTGAMAASTQLSESDSEKRTVIEKSSQEISDLILRDATEQYLFIREAMTTAGRIWSPVITGLMFLALYICLADAYIIFWASSKSHHFTNIKPLLYLQLIIFVTIRVSFLVFYPILSIAFANSYLLKLSDVFRVAGQEDYAVIGGRDRWLDFLQNFPAVWTYYGVYITPERLAGLVWTSFVAFVTVALTTLASTTL